LTASDGAKKQSFQNAACWRRAVCYIANDLQPVNLINRRTRERIFRATAVLSLAVWLFMAAAELYTPLHAWLHGGTIPKDDDDCAIVAIAHGKIETVSPDIAVPVPITWIEVTPQIESSIFSTTIALLPNGRAPPSLSAVS
jgi:hypothetical protein